MDRLSSTEVKNRLGAVLASLQAPVCVERHGRVVAYLLPPDAEPLSRQALERKLARLQQAGVEKDRLARHQRIALELLTSPAALARRRIEAACAEVDRWERERLCSREYIRRWRALLKLPLAKLAKALGSDLDGWGTALRQNSPWRE